MAGLRDIVVPTTDGQTVIFKPGELKLEWEETMQLDRKSLQLLIPYTSHLVPGPEDCTGA